MSDRTFASKTWRVLCSGSLCIVIGCTSITSRMLSRDASNTQWEEACLNGIPITLKVPTHLKVYVYDKHYLEFVNGQSVVQPVHLDVPVRDFASEFMYTDKIFTVDFKRPVAGAFNLRLAMSDEQYFSQIQHDVTDTTIADVTTLLGDILKAPPKLTGGDGSGTSAPNVSELKSVVAVGVFEIDDPNFQAQVLEFVNCHLNKSHDAWVAPPGVVNLNRTQIPASDNTAIPYPAIPLCPGGQCPEPHLPLLVPLAIPDPVSSELPSPSPAPDSEPTPPTSPEPTRLLEQRPEASSVRRLPDALAKRTQKRR